MKRLEIPLWVVYNASVWKRARSSSHMQKGISSEKENSKRTEATQAKNSISSA